MPELPEVETLSRQLRKKIKGKKISATEVYDDKLAGIKTLPTERVVGIERWGKTIDIQLESGKSILIHLRMTGRLIWKQSAERPKHGRWRAGFEKGNLFLIDPRRFATVKIERTKTEKIKNDLIADFDEKAFLEQQAGRKMNLKTLLMDPKAIAGIGNIYASEILHRSGISPLRQASSLTIREWKIIFDSARQILKKGIENRGTSISDWRDLYGRAGENQKELKVYGRKGKYCSTCGGTISRIKQGGRSTFYCRTCQK